MAAIGGGSGFRPRVQPEVSKPEPAPVPENEVSEPEPENEPDEVEVRDLATGADQGYSAAEYPDVSGGGVPWPEPQQEPEPENEVSAPGKRERGRPGSSGQAQIHGTYGGYQLHYRHGELPCGLCKAAAADYQRNYRQTHSEQRVRHRRIEKTRRQALEKLAREHPDRFKELVAEFRKGHLS